MARKNNLCDFILFGGHGDLAFRKLMPALFHLSKDGYLEDESRIITISRRSISNQEHKTLVKERLIEFLPKDSFTEKDYEIFSKKLLLITVDFSTNEGYDKLQEVLNEFEDRERINYLSTSPAFFGGICQALSKWDLITEKTRVVLEKPLGRDLKSSQEINKKVLSFFKEDQIYRIDHYLGKDTVQNIMALRFSNRLFVHLWSSNHIDHVQITVAENVGAEGRWDYYNDYGAMRDMIQNHLMQLLCLIAMEPPCSLDANDIRDEKVKILKTLRPITTTALANSTVRAQYTAGSSIGESVPGYLDGEVTQSNTETFAAMRVDIDNWRWNGVPFYIRSGKRMQKRNSEIVIQVKT
ncbi:MAG: glucose-6-phosphate dehydrogenase, partial [Halarcobacter sp.]